MFCVFFSDHSLHCCFLIGLLSSFGTLSDRATNLGCRRSCTRGARSKNSNSSRSATWIKSPKSPSHQKPLYPLQIRRPILRPCFLLSGSTYPDIAILPLSCVKLSEHDFVRIFPRTGERSRTLGRPVILGTDAMIAAILNLPACVSTACSSFSNPFRRLRKSAAPLRHFRLAFSVPFRVLRLEAPTWVCLDLRGT